MDIILSTTSSLEGYEVEEYIGFVTGESGECKDAARLMVDNAKSFESEGNAIVDIKVSCWHDARKQQNRYLASGTFVKVARR